MNDHQTAWDVLGCGDALRGRVECDESTVAAVAADAGLPLPIAAKAHWLAGIYPDSIRCQISSAVLQRLSAMHLEVVARCDDTLKVRLLRAAACDGLTARALRKMVRAEDGKGGGGAGGGTIAALEQSARAMEQYTDFDDRSLRTLISGPNGAKVRQAALAGRSLSERLSAVRD
jgi:hypothetical protein